MTATTTAKLTPRQRLIEMAASRLRMLPRSTSDGAIQAVIEGILAEQPFARAYYAKTSYTAQTRLIADIRARATETAAYLAPVAAPIAAEVPAEVTAAALPVKSITYDRETKDFEVTVDGQHVGYAPTYLAGEALANDFVYNLLSRPAGDVVVTEIVETPAGDVAVREVVLAEVGDLARHDYPALCVVPGCGIAAGPVVCDICGRSGMCAWHANGGICMLCANPAPATTEEGAMGAETYQRGVMAATKQAKPKADRLTDKMIAVLRRLAKGPADAHYGTGYATGRALHSRGLARARGVGSNGPSSYEITKKGLAVLDALDAPDTTEEATEMDAQTYEREVVAVEQAGTGEYAGRYDPEAGVNELDCDPVPTCMACGGMADEVGNLISLDDGTHVCRAHAGPLLPSAADAYQAPVPLPVCPCGTTYTTHAIPGCECAAEAAAQASPLNVPDLPPTYWTVEDRALLDRGTVRWCAICPGVNAEPCAECGVLACDTCAPFDLCPSCAAKARAEAPPPAPSASEPTPDSSDQDKLDAIAAEIKKRGRLCIVCDAHVQRRKPCPRCEWPTLCGACYSAGRCCPDCEPESLPFTPGPAESADALAEIEAAAGVLADEPPPSELALQFAETTRRLVEWQDTVANGGDWVAARRAHIDAMLEVERFAGLKAWPAVVGQAA